MRSICPCSSTSGLAGELPAYGDRFGANPSLVYARSREPNTRMKYRRQGKTTTYEWAIQAYDRYPEAPTRLEPGKRIGLDVAVVDKDSGRTKPAFLTWASPPKSFKFLDAGIARRTVPRRRPLARRHVGPGNTLAGPSAPSAAAITDWRMAGFLPPRAGIRDHRSEHGVGKSRRTIDSCQTVILQLS